MLRDNWPHDIVRRKDTAMLNSELVLICGKPIPANTGLPITNTDFSL
jgi:hypothetical protein